MFESYLLGKVLVLCPACQHSPQSLNHFDGGHLDVRVLVVVDGGLIGEECSCGEAGPPSIVPVGFGQVVSIDGGVTRGECSCGGAGSPSIVSVGFGQVVSFTLSG